MRLRRAGHVAWRRVGDETVLIHLRKKRMYVLNPSAGFFWHRLDGTQDDAELVSISGIATDEGARVQVARFLERLREAELVEAGEHGASALPGAPVSEYPFDHFAPPELVWQEDIRNFGQSCAFSGGQSEPCNAAPTI